MIYLIIIIFIFFLFYNYIYECYYDINYNNYLNVDDVYYQNYNTTSNISKHMNSNKCLDIKDNKLILNKCDNSDNQKWEYSDYKITNKKKNKCIDKNFNIVNCDNTVDKFIKINYNNGFFYKLYSPENCINVEKNNILNIKHCDPIVNQYQIFTNIDDQIFNNYDDELKINLYFEILKDYKIFQKNNKYSNEFKKKFNINTFNLYYNFYIKYGDNYKDKDIELLHKNIDEIINNLNKIREDITIQSYEYNLKQLSGYKLYDNIFSYCTNKYNVFSFIDFKNKYDDSYTNEDLQKLYNSLVDDNKSDKECLNLFKNYIDLKNYKLFDYKYHTGAILNDAVNKFNINLFINFKNKYKNDYKKNDLLSLYNILFNDKNTNKNILTEFKFYIDELIKSSDDNIIQK